MRILYVEPFDGGSHAMFTRVVTSALQARWTRITLPGRHWKWHMRVAAVHAVLERSEALAADHDLVLASSYVPLAELVGLCPRLATIPRVLYFHENQLAYPAHDERMPERDFHYGFTQLVSALAADLCLFNSSYNADSFLEAAESLLSRMPDAVPADWLDRIRRRTEIMSVPLDLPDTPPPVQRESQRGPLLLWNHRWEHDKDPETFFAALRELEGRGLRFRVIVCGESYTRRPAVFDQARELLGDRVEHWGFAPSRAAYLDLLGRADVAVSTARHEFFGVSMLEATHLGAWPLVPDRLAYPELFPEAYRYADERELVSRLVGLCERHAAGQPLRADRREITRPHLASRVIPQLAARLQALIQARP
jgi:glycosyltransferase involved in cell wall biosynthesis